MTALSLRAIVAEELARVGVEPGSVRGEQVRRTEFAADLPGFGTRHYPSGKRSYIAQCRMGGRMRTVTIGSAAVLTEPKARDVARRVLLRAQVGENPAEMKISTRAKPSFAAMVDEYWTRMAPRWKRTTQVTQASYRARHLDQAFPGMFVDQIEQEHVARWFAHITENTGPGAANRAFEILKAMMRKAEEWGYRGEGTNPCHGIRRNRQRRFERFLSEQELARLGAALDRARADDPLRAAAITMIVMTGCRRSEIMDLRWSEVKGSRLLLQDSKTGARTVWLGFEARAVLGAIPRPRGAEYVFPADGIARTYALERFWRHVRSEAGLADVRLHDLRHSFASFAARRSETLPMIGKLLGHVKIATTARYAHLDDRSLVESMERVGRLIAGKLV